jgi:hypothetical protein
MLEEQRFQLIEVLRGLHQDILAVQGQGKQVPIHNLLADLRDCAPKVYPPDRNQYLIRIENGLAEYSEISDPLTGERDVTDLLNPEPYLFNIASGPATVSAPQQPFQTFSYSLNQPNCPPGQGQFFQTEQFSSQSYADQLASPTGLYQHQNNISNPMVMWSSPPPPPPPPVLAASSSINPSSTDFFYFNPIDSSSVPQLQRKHGHYPQ